MSKAKAVKKTRMSQAERSAAMRHRLASAAFEVIREVGFANFRTSAVAQKAGVSEGAQLHHYPTKNDLSIAAMEYAYEKSHTVFIRNLSSFTADSDPIEAALKDVEDFFFSDYFMVALDILMAGGKNEDLRQRQTQLAVSARSIVEQAWIRKLVEYGWEETLAQDIMNLTFCIVRGFAIKTLIIDNQEEYRKLLSRWKSMVSNISY